MGKNWPIVSCRMPKDSNFSFQDSKFQILPDKNLIFVARENRSFSRALIFTIVIGARDLAIYASLGFRVNSPLKQFKFCQVKF